jgi:hypothetical protein
MTCSCTESCVPEHDIAHFAGFVSVKFRAPNIHSECITFAHINAGLDRLVRWIVPR